MLNAELTENTYNPVKQAKLFYMALNNLNSDPVIYRTNSNRRQGRAGKFYLCWIDNQRCLHHFKDGDYNRPYSSNNLFKLLKIVHNDPKKNWFLAPTTFRSRQIRDELFNNGKPNARTITSFYFDFDVVKSGLDMNTFYQKLPVILDKCHIVPNAVINSGHGYHVYILLNQGNPVNSPKIIKYWERTEKDMVDAISRECKKMFGKPVIDTKVKDLPRVLRVAGSYNMKNPHNPAPVKLVYLDRDNRSSFKSLMDKWHDLYLARSNYERTDRELSRQQRRHRSSGHTTRTLNYSRCTDLFTLARLRKINGIKDGYRDLILFYYEVCAVRPNHNGLQTYSDKQTIDNVKALNKSFLRPLSDNQVASIAYEIPLIHQKIQLEAQMKRHHRDFKTRYCPSNQTMIHDLVITEAEQRHMVTIIDHKEAKRRKPNNYRNELKRRKKRRERRRMKRNNRRDVINKRIIQLHESGLSIRKIAKQVNISKSAVGRTIKAHNQSVPKHVPFRYKLGAQNKQSDVVISVYYINTVLIHKLSNEPLVISNSYLDNSLNTIVSRRIRDD